MKLSEAIRLGAMATEHVTHVYMIINADGSIGTCAIGSALYAVGQYLRGYAVRNYLIMRWRWLSGSHLVQCHACGCRAHVMETIIHLNDHHLWSRERIAYWVSMIEPQEQVLLEDQREEQPAREYTEVTQ